MKDPRNNWVVEVLVHVVVFSTGIIILLLGKDWSAVPYIQAIMVNLGSSLIAVTLLFGITRFFAPRQSESKPMGTPSPIESNGEPSGQRSQRTKVYADELRQAEVLTQPKLTSDEKKVKS